MIDYFISLLIDSPKVDCCALRILSVISQEGSYSIITIKIRNYFKIVIAGIVSKGASIASDGCLAKGFFLPYSSKNSV